MKTPKNVNMEKWVSSFNSNHWHTRFNLLGKSFGDVALCCLFIFVVCIHFVYGLFVSSDKKVSEY